MPGSDLWDYETEPLAFDELVAIEPELGAMRQQARDWDAHELYCLKYVWVHHFKRRLPSLVGWTARATGDDRIYLARSYDTAYQEILRSLPPCNHEGECW